MQGVEFNLDKKLNHSRGAGGGSPLIFKFKMFWDRSGGLGVEPPARRQVKLALFRPGIILG